MGRHRCATRLRRRIALALVVTLGLPTALATVAGAAAPQLIGPDTLEPADQAGAVTELSEHKRLADRRSLVVGDRLYAMSAADGRYPAMGFHTRGEMGGFWTPPIKLLDGIWFGDRRRLARSGDRDDERVGLRPGRPADAGRGAGQPGRLRAGRRPARA